MSFMILSNGKTAKQSGLTLIEVLISMLLLTIGILGALSLQLVSTKGNFDAKQRTEATMLANAIIDHMRANPEVLDCYAETNLGYGADGSTDCTAAGASGLLGIANDDRDYLDSLADALGAGSGSLVAPLVCITDDYASAGDGHVRVVVAWQGFSSRADSSNLADADCGAATGTSIDSEYLKQVVLDTYVYWLVECRYDDYSATQPQLRFYYFRAFNQYGSGFISHR